MNFLLIILPFIAPTVSITNLVNDQIVRPGTVTINASATNASRVVFYNNLTVITTDFTIPFSASINLAKGKYTLRARAYDNTGSYRTASVNITVEEDYSLKIAELEKRLNKMDSILNLSDTVNYDPLYFKVLRQSEFKYFITKP